MLLLEALLDCLALLSLHGHLDRVALAFYLECQSDALAHGVFPLLEGGTRPEAGPVFVRTT